MKYNDLAVRMRRYEDSYRYKLSPRTFTICRNDGKAFHTWTKRLPFDEGLIEDMNNTAIHLCENIMGCKACFVQSDEISCIFTDFDSIYSEPWFDGTVQKIASVSASYTTSKFNQLRTIRMLEEAQAAYTSINKIKRNKLANFDSRVFQITFIEEVINYFINRQQDATRNSISSVAQSLYSHKELDGKNSNQLQEMIFQKGVNWNDLDEGKKRGRLITKVEKEITTDKGTAIRNKWEVVETPIFSTPEGKELLRNIILPLKQ